MKKLLLSTVLTVISIVSFAQITITQADYGQAGDSIVVGNDEQPPTGLSVGGTGMQTWNFTSLSLSNINTLKFEDPTNTTSGAFFPNSDLAIERLSDTLFFRSSATEFVIDGFAGAGFGLPLSFVADFNPNSTQVEFPSTFGDSFVDTAIIDTTVGCDAFGFGSTCDSARLKRILIANSTINAFGEISTPGGEFTTVRQYFREENFDTVWIKVPILGWINFLDSTSTAHNYRWMANGEDWPVLSVRADAAGGDIVSAEYVVGARVLGFVSGEEPPSCDGACDGSATVSAVGGVPPYSYAWPTGQTTPAATGLCDGEYLVTITDSDTGSYEVTVVMSSPSPLAIAGAVQGVSVGADGAIDISVTGGTTPYAFSWTGPDGFTSNDQDIADLEEGEYTVDVVDANGCDTSRTFLVEPTGIDEEPSAALKVFPNPVNDVLTIQAEDQVESFTLTDQTGRIVLQDVVRSSVTEISVESIPNGIYVLKLSTSEGDYIRRLSVQH